jgi:hypothetical protein
VLVAAPGAEALLLEAVAYHLAALAAVALLADLEVAVELLPHLQAEAAACPG